MSPEEINTISIEQMSTHDINTIRCFTDGSKDAEGRVGSATGNTGNTGITGITGPQTTQVQPAQSQKDRSLWSYIMSGEGVAGWNMRNDPKPGVSPQASTGASVATPASTTATIATPVSPTPTSVNPGTVNTPEKDAKADADRKVAAAQAATVLAPPGAQDPADVLKQILDILKQSLMAENQQVDLTGQILRSQALMPTLPDKAAMYQQTVRQ